MEIILEMVLPLLCGLALFLFGMDLMGDSLKKSAGSSLKQILGKMTSNPIKGFLLGLGVTMVIQSSSATTVMVVGFVNSAIYMAGQLPGYKYISTHNKINFIDTIDKNAEISPRLAFGLFALLNSTIYDRYISIMSKSKQINSKEMKDLPLPPRNIIENIGMRVMSARQTSVAVCDQIVNPTLHIIGR